MTYKVIQGEQSSRFGQEYVHQKRVVCTELRCSNTKSSWWHWEDSKSVIYVHQMTSSRSGLADMGRHISRSDGNIGEEILHNKLSES